MYSFSDLKRNLKKDFSTHKNVRLAVLSDSASQLLCTAIRGYGFEKKLNLEIYEADFNQVSLQVFDSSSELYESKPEYVFINTATEKLLKEFCKKDKAGQVTFAEEFVQQQRQYVEIVTQRTGAKVILNTLPYINDSVFGNFAAKTASSFIYQIRKANVLLMELSQELKNLYLCDIAGLQSELGHGTVFDSKMYISADMVYSLDFLPYIAKHVNDIILSITGDFKKCLILDLDNTTWGGIIGDDGIEGIQIGYLGMGKAFTELQLWAKQLKNRGIILAICSKNTESIAKEPFLKHPDMVLRLEDIAVFTANWETKVDNIRHIQSILNIGFDSMVFLDDNPFEREMVKSGIPALTVPDLPEDPAEYLSYLRSLNLFETASFTEEDGNRTKQYQVEAERSIFQQSFDSEDNFLKSLEMVAEVKPFDSFSIPRVAQLSQRSNQFNLRTVRYTDEEIRAISSNPDYHTLTFSLSDKFGEHGLIAVIILKKENDNSLFIDTWIMSCRVLKRGMERFTLNAIVKLASFLNFEHVIGEYLPTNKNGIVKDHYQSLGFEQQGDNKWILKVAEYKKTDTFISYKQNTTHG